ncbi:MAG: SurA N-terminal domain-containing protein [Bacteroidales bacterium]|nr:SurA N-terminal domain-containing protein [Bacteroidales bacterium]
MITILVALALLSFILDPSTLRNFVQMASRENKVGEMAGKSITYKDFYEQYDRFSKLAEMTGQRVNDEEAQKGLRDAAWQEILDENVFLPMAAKAGLFVSDQEMFDLTQGSSISPVLSQQGMFADKDGNFNRAALAQFVQSIDSDETGNTGAYWNFLESTVYKSQLYNKYTSLLQASSLQTKAEKELAMKDNNLTADVDFVMLPVGFEEDTTVNVSREEINAYFNERKDLMTQPANRDIRYVMLEVEPSQEDFEDTRTKFNELYEEFTTAENLKNFVALNSDAKLDTYYYKESQLDNNPEFKAVFNSNDATSAMHEEENSYQAARVLDRRQMSDSARVYYALFPLEQEASADSLLGVLRRSGLTPEMTELGWFTQEAGAASGLSEFVPVLFAGEKAVKVKMTASQAWFVLYAAERTRPSTKVQFATLIKNVLPSENTYRDYLMRATEISDKTGGDARKLAEVAEEEKLTVVPVTHLTEDTRRIGACDNARELVRWVFDKKTKRGSVSDVIIVDNKYYFVAAVDRIRKEGKMDVRDVANEIRNILASEKKIEMMKEDAASKIQGCNTLEEVAEALGTTVSHNDGVSFGSQFQQLDNKFVGAIANAEEGKIYGPVAGDVGVYVFQVAKKNEGSFFTEADAATAVSQKGAYAANMLQAVLNDVADVKDYRARFF